MKRWTQPLKIFQGMVLIDQYKHKAQHTIPEWNLYMKGTNPTTLFNELDKRITKKYVTFLLALSGHAHMHHIHYADISQTYTYTLQLHVHVHVFLQVKKWKTLKRLIHCTHSSTSFNIINKQQSLRLPDERLNRITNSLH